MRQSDDQKSISEKVREILADVLCYNPSELQPGWRLVEDMSMDDMDAIELIAFFEDKFEIDLDDDFEQWLTADPTVQQLEEKLQEIITDLVEG